MTEETDDALRHAAGRLLAAAAAYWAAYRKAFGGNAVVWVEDRAGALVVLTRGEYRDQIMANIAPLAGPHAFAQARDGGAAYMRDVQASEREAVTKSMGAGFAPGAPWNSRTEAERAAHPGDLSSVERLDFTKPPPGYEVDTTTFTFAAPSETAASGLERCIANIDGTSKVSGRDQTLAAAWSHYKGEHDPPGLQVVKRDNRYAVGLVVTTRDPVLIYDSEEMEGEARDVAWSWYETRLALADKLDEPRDCDACGGEAVAPAVLAAHKEACEAVSHDIRDDGGGRCNSCGVELAPCPSCGPYHGRRPPCDGMWPRCLTWSDEQVAEVERWLVDSTAEMPEVLGG